MVERTKDRLRHARRSVLIGAIALMVLIGGLVALADHPASSGFDIDGVVPDGGTTNFADPSGNTKELGPVNSSTTKLGVIHNDAVPTLGKSNPNGQVDLVNVWFDSNSAAGTDWLYFAWERDSNKGSGVIAIEFQANAAPLACDYATTSEADLIAGCNPWANRAEGDFILIWDQVGNDIEISIRTFDGTAFGAPVLLDEHEQDAALSADNTRGEAVVDLGIVFPPEPTECLSIANVIPGTVTGNSDTADYKDTVLADIAGAVQISNCGSLELEKTDDLGNPLAGAVFTLYDDDGDDLFEPDGDDTITTYSCTTGADGGCEIEDIFFGDYWIDETTVPANHVKAIGMPQKVSIAGTTTVDLGTFVNPRQVGSIIVEKVVTGTSTRIGGASFAIDEDGDGATTDDQTVIPAVSGETGLYCIDNLLFDDYTVVETAAPSGFADATGSQSHTVDSRTNCADRIASSDTPDLTFQNQALTALVTAADETVTVGAQISDTATLSGGFNPTGTITFQLYDNATCTGTPVFTDSKTVNGNGDYGPVNYTTTATGTYYWLASYSGDTSNVGSSHDCADDGEVDTVNSAAPTLVTAADETVTVGAQISDTATLSGGFNPTGTITFQLYDNATCTGTPVFTDSKTVNGNGDYGPVNYTTTATGTYYWLASYSGDSNNQSATHSCGATGEVDTVNSAAPTLVTAADETVTVGAQISDTATLSGGFNPTGTITFQLYDNATCTGTPVFTDSKTVNGNGDYGPVNYTTTATGTYYWLASYSGDSNNQSATHSCGATGEVDTVGKASPGINTTPVLLPNDSATLTGGFGTLSGTLTFELYGNATCATDTDPIYEEDVTVNGIGMYSTSNTSVFITADGTYSWLVTYTGDGNNNGATSTCDAEQMVIDFTPLQGGPA